MTHEIITALDAALDHLLNSQHETGKFEGLLSSSTYPTCGYAVIQRLLGREIPGDLIDWLVRTQNEEHMWGLDSSRMSDPDATALVRAVLSAASKSAVIPDAEAALKQAPQNPPSVFHVKLLSALLDEFEWESVLPRRSALIGVKILAALPRFIRSRLDVPKDVTPPPELFSTRIFRDLFVAEQQTLVPVFVIIETRRNGLSALARSLLDWMLSRRLPNGSWFNVGFITELAAIAMIRAREEGMSEMTPLIDQTLNWLDGLRNPDGGIREAVDLNVWDTALSVCTLIDAEHPPKSAPIERACRWLMSVQNEDGGWAFSGFPWSDLASDADDTALATLALIKAGLGEEKSVERGLDWLRANQTRQGCWCTYVPGAGDVGCVSITAHAAEVFLSAGGMETELNRALNWLEKQITPEGWWDDLWLARKTYGTANALAILAKSGRQESDAVRRGIDWLKRTQNPDGGWGEDMFGRKTESTVEQTAWSVSGLLCAENRISPETKRGLEYILKNQKPNGSWQPSSVGIYWEVIGGYADPIYADIFPIRALNLGRKLT